MRLHIIIFFLSYTFICALTLNVEELKVDNAVAPEKILEKRQVSVLDAELITDIGGTRYTCPANYQLVGSQCHHVDCIYERTTTNIECLIPATPIYAGCGAGYTYTNGQCMRMETLVVCPAGTFMEGNQCVYRVPGPPVVYVDFICPPGSYKDTINKQCVYTAQIPAFVSECPRGYQRSGDTCFLQLRALSFRCPDGTTPIGNFCTVQVPPGRVRVECPPNSRLIGNYVCELLPLQVTVQCHDGSRPDAYNRCRLRANDTTYLTPCPLNSVERNGKCYVEARMTYPIPTIEYLCPRNFKRVGDLCIMDIPSIETHFRCPENTVRQGNDCIYRVADAKNYNVTADCPINSRYIDRKGCEGIFRENVDMTCERIIQSPKCCKKRSCSRSVTSIHNVNHVYIPTNITSTNINTINIGQGSSSCEGSSCNNKNETTKPCDEKPVEVEEKKCCTVVTPRVCENHQGDWQCGHREYERCGPMCVQDVIHLKASRPIYRDQMLVMPPPRYGMRVHPRHNEHVNCYGCLNGRYDCSPECYEYDCASDGCNLMEQNTFCGTYGGEGCAPADGYYNF